MKIPKYINGTIHGNIYKAVISLLFLLKFRKMTFENDFSGKTSKVNSGQVSIDCSPCERNNCYKNGISLELS